MVGNEGHGDSGDSYDDDHGSGDGNSLFLNGLQSRGCDNDDDDEDEDTVDDDDNDDDDDDITTAIPQRLVGP